MKVSTQRILRHQSQFSNHNRQLSQSSKSLQVTAASASSSKPSTKRSSRLAKRPGSDLVGQPDPISNLRPIKYGSAFESDPSSSSPNSNSSSTHPYSLAEFTSPSSSNGLGSSSKNSAPKPYSNYFLRLAGELEEAELIHRLRRSKADSFNQRFWQDNNSRFQSDLKNFTSANSNPSQIPAPSSQSTSSNSPSTSIPTSTSSSQLQATSAKSAKPSPEVDLAPFYSAWLSANSTRHQRYNRSLVGQIFRDLGPAARYSVLRKWVGVVRKWEELRRRGPA